MYLKSVEMVGYKSFAVRTKLELEPGITGIVGPNGCGKSNIMEAVRWCLGEMSWKSLRADSMVDVIFAGTAKRPALSMTEVTLVFDNSQSLLPVQYSEVTISRRIFRSGESEYHLNKTQCRLRDIRELFLDTGIGGDGYAIIDQGGVDFVLSAKPEDRRSIFEEAAGVAKYKAKREEALRKLDRVEQDMARLQDSVTLIEEQVKKLDSDARKAKLYKKYKEELSALEAAHMIEQLDQIQRELESLSALVRPIEESLGSRRTAMSAEGANLAALNLERANQQNQVTALGQKISDVKSQAGILRERVENAARDIVECDERRGQCEAELGRARGRQTEIDREIDQARAALSAGQERLARARAEAEQAEEGAQKVQAELAAAEATLESSKTDGLRAAEETMALRRQSSQLESARSHKEVDLRSTLKGLDKGMAEAEGRRKEAWAAQLELDRETFRAASARAFADYGEAAAADDRRLRTELAEEKTRLREELVGLEARAESLQILGEQNPYWTGAHAVVNAGIEGVVGTVGQILRAEDPVRAQLQDVLGERLFAVVCEDSAAARAAIEFLNETQKGRARFLILSTLSTPAGERAYPEQARPLLEQLRYEPRHEKAVRYLLEESYQLGKCLFGDHWVYGGAVPRESQQLNLSDLGELREKISSSQGCLDELAARREKVEAELVLIEAEARALIAEAGDRSRREGELKAAVKHRQESLVLTEKDVELSTDEAARLLAEIALVSEELQGLGRRVAQSEAKEAAAREWQESVARVAAGIREELSRAHSARELSVSKLQSFEREATLLTDVFNRVALEKESLDQTISRREADLSELARKREEAAVLQAKAREELEALGAELADLERESIVANDQLRGMEAAIAQKEEVLRGLKAEADGLSDQLHQHELQASAQRSRHDMLKTRLWEDWQLTYEEAKSKYAGQTADPQRIESLRKRLANMGNINMAAPEEYEALSSKQAFLASQIADLTKAKEDLKNAIAKINASTRENFRQTFTEVREQFRRLYGVLFEGGEADLILTEPENILETGVEIVAQPPGKRLQSISLLSGGEKTLTAIALLFAFFMVKPSPFCMLDEADAALDDANIGRFVSLLKEFQNRSQFLIVSHNKRTMEAADVIYGVTMEEMGVSQLVSVDFRKKQAGAPGESAPGPSVAPAGPAAAPSDPLADPA